MVRLNHALAVGKAGEPAGGLTMVDALSPDRALRGYPQLPGGSRGARTEFSRAADLTRNESERTLFHARIRALEPTPES